METQSQDHYHDEEEEQEMEVDGMNPIEQRLVDLETVFNNGMTIEQLLTEVFQYGTDMFSPTMALQIYEELQTQIVLIHAHAEEVNAELRMRVNTAVKRIENLYTILVELSNFHDGAAASFSLSTEHAILRFRSPGDVKEKAIQLVYRFVLAWCRRLNVRHQQGRVFSEVYAESGQRTYAWLPATNVGGRDISSLTLLVGYICTKQHNPDIWLQWLTTNVKAVCEKLDLSLEPEFMPLKTSRAWMSFADGLYSVMTDTFIRYEDAAGFGVPTDLATCSFHNMPFAPAMESHPMLNNKTPLLDTILETQRLCGHTKFWVLAMLGKALYWNKVLETWQVATYFRGLAGTGKSSLVTLVSKIYAAVNVAIVSNDTQKTFGLMNFTNNTYVWAASEVKTDFAMEQATFQSIVTGETVSIARKQLCALETEILAPGYLAGNSLPLTWTDNSGSIRRRVFLVAFRHQPERVHQDMLESMITEELPFILRKLNYCYRYGVVLSDGQDLWQSGLLSILLMHENNDIFHTMNPLHGFMGIGEITYGATKWMPLTTFREMFLEYQRSTSCPKQQWTTDLYDAVFASKRLSVKKARYYWGTEPPKVGLIVWGCEPQDADVPYPDNVENPELLMEADTVYDVFQ
jgi:hypothetical protein